MSSALSGAERAATWSAPGEGERLWFLGTLAIVRVPGEATERFVRDGSVPGSAPTLPPADTPRPDPEQLEQIFREHRQINVGPPLGVQP
jgi:hypothetical protein